jgi:chromosome segregation ATPase
MDSDPVKILQLKVEELLSNLEYYQQRVKDIEETIDRERKQYIALQERVKSRETAYEQEIEYHKNQITDSTKLIKKYEAAIEKLKS